MKATAVISMLHQPADRPGSAERLFRREPVLAWTLRRLGGCRGIDGRTVLCWEDQVERVRPIAGSANCHVLAKSPRCRMPMIEAIAAARKWCDGWRGGLLGASCFDQGFHAAWAEEIRRQLGGDAVVLIDPDAGLVDPALIDGLVEHAREHPSIDYCFAPAAPGLGGMLIRERLLGQLAATDGYPGRLLSYWPDLPGRDPIAKDECVPVPTAVARTTARFTLDSDRQVARLERATISLNGQLMRTEAQRLVCLADSGAPADALPRDVVLEINSGRGSNPVYWPGRYLSIARAEMKLETARALLAELSAADDVRLTLGGVGDPMLASGFFSIIAAAREAGIDSIHVETDLLKLDESAVRKLVESPVDIVSVHVPAVLPRTYEAVMGVDGLEQVIRNIRCFLLHRHSLGRATPILVPTFTKCQANLEEMEAWYDHWLRTVGAAVIVGAGDYAGQIPDVAAADMTPPGRCACRRLGSRVTVLCDGTVVSCEQDVLGRQVLGRVGQQGIGEVYRTGLAELRAEHESRRWDAHPLCKTCREWHRP